MDTTKTVREQILEHAITLMMMRGYHGFSYRDLSALVGVKTSSIHYYFPSKDDLVLEAVNAYSAQALESIRSLDGEPSAPAKLERYSELFGRVLGNGNQICLCGMLAADIESLPERVRQAIQVFFRANENWLAKTLEQGVRAGTVALAGDPKQAARALFAAFQGSVITSRLFQTRSRLEDVDALWKAAAR